MRRVRVIVNPSARDGRGARLLAGRPRLEGVELEWVESASGEDLATLVREAARDDLDAVAVAGGDGTVQLALAALDGTSRVPLAILPVGSGNDFARDAGVPRVPADALALLATGVPRAVDVGVVEASGTRFCCVASAGLDELALRIVHGSGLPRSKALNVYASLRGLFAYEPRRVRISWEGGAIEDELAFAAVTNTSSYAGGFRVSPLARVDDGLLDLCFVRAVSKPRLLRALSRVLDGSHAALPEVTLAQSPWVRLEGDLPLALDGELPAHAAPVTLRCLPGALTLLLPAGAAARRAA